MTLLSKIYSRATLIKLLLVLFVLLAGPNFSAWMTAGNSPISFAPTISTALAQVAEEQSPAPSEGAVDDQPIEEDVGGAEQNKDEKDKLISERRASDKTPLPDHTSFRLSTLPSYQNIPQSRIVEYEFAMSHGLCAPVLDMEREGLLVARPEFEQRFGRGVKIDPVDLAALHNYALGFRRCVALRDLAKGLAIARLKGGEEHFAKFVPKPRLGNFINEERSDLQQLLIDRQDERGLDRPIDWAADPLPIEEEVQLHQAFTELTQLAVCHAVPLAFEDIGKLHDKGFTPIDPFLMYGLFHQAIWLQIQPAAMKARLEKMDELFQQDQREELDSFAARGILHKHSRLDQLFGICPQY